jgi:hypothetical protein
MGRAALSNRKASFAPPPVCFAAHRTTPPVISFDPGLGETGFGVRESFCATATLIALDGTGEASPGADMSRAWFDTPPGYHCHSAFAQHRAGRG